MRRGRALWGSLLLCFALAACAGVPEKTVFSSAVGRGFGVQIKETYASQEELARIKAAGFGVVRFAVGWPHIEKEKNVFDWRETDALVARVRGAGLGFVLSLLGGNPLYDGMVAVSQPNADHVRERIRAPSRPESVDAYARFAAQAVARYDGPDVVWEVWNEPDLPRFWPPRPVVASYVVLAEAACHKMRAVAPKATIVGPGLGRVPDPRDGVGLAFLGPFLSSGAFACMDALSIHPYRHGAEKPEAAFGDYRRLFPVMAAYRTYKPLVNSEWGYTGTQVSEQERAAFVLRTRLIDVLFGIPLSIWYEWKDSRTDPSDPEGRFGLVRGDGTAKPSLEAIEAFLPFLEETVLERQVHTANARDLLLLLKAPGGTKILVGWSLRETLQPSVSFVLEGQEKTAQLSSLPQILGRGARLEAISLKEPTTP